MYHSSANITRSILVSFIAPPLDDLTEAKNKKKDRQRNTPEEIVSSIDDSLSILLVSGLKTHKLKETFLEI